MELTDRLVWMIQARVAGIRLERDLRAATASNPQGWTAPLCCWRPMPPAW